MRQVTGRRMGSVRGGGVPAVRLIRLITVAVVHCSGEEFCGSLAAILREIRGEKGRRGSAICRRARRRKRPGIKAY
jgi:hypothetical protein